MKIKRIVGVALLAVEVAALLASVVTKEKADKEELEEGEEKAEETEEKTEEPEV